ncbi:hypothetical protein [Microbacterium testaceum]|uniref:hypothetical protein n=1 Tax=Microbacterium testaceum TaxID=2033 RepID=UPI002AC46865|nr:hypothetical protein [Microbacterium testaceum]MDZ5146333.1 hypothetical protein [Microbacterium testaceum]
MTSASDERDEARVESVPAWKLALKERVFRPAEWERWYFIRVFVYAMMTVTLSVVVALSTAAAAAHEPQSIYDVSGYIYKLLSMFSGVFAAWAAFMLIISALGLFVARRRLSRCASASDTKLDGNP